VLISFSFYHILPGLSHPLIIILHSTRVLREGVYRTTNTEEKPGVMILNFPKHSKIHHKTNKKTIFHMENQIS